MCDIDAAERAKLVASLIKHTKDLIFGGAKAIHDKCQHAWPRTKMGWIPSSFGVGRSFLILEFDIHSYYYFVGLFCFVLFCFVL